MMMYERSILDNAIVPASITISTSPHTEFCSVVLSRLQTSHSLFEVLYCQGSEGDRIKKTARYLFPNMASDTLPPSSKREKIAIKPGFHLVDWMKLTQVTRLCLFCDIHSRSLSLSLSLPLSSVCLSVCLSKYVLSLYSFIFIRILLPRTLLLLLLVFVSLQVADVSGRKGQPLKRFSMKGERIWLRGQHDNSCT